MAYVDITGSSGLGIFRFTTPLISRVRALVSPLRIPAPPPPAPVVVAPAPAIMPRRTAFVDPITQVVTTIKPAIMPIRPTTITELVLRKITPLVSPPMLIPVPVGMPAIKPLVFVTRPPTLVRPAITTAISVAKTAIRRISPMYFEQRGIARELIEKLRAPSGATYSATSVKVVAGADPVSKSITGAGAPMTGQSVSLKESAPIVAVAPSAQGITLVEKPAPTQMPLITFKPIEIETLPGEVPEVAKAGIPPIVYLIMAGIALPMLFKKKRKRRR